MGCAPSKGNNFGTLGPLRKGRMLPPSPLESPRERLPEERSNYSLTGSADWDTKERKAAAQSQNFQKEVPLPSQKRCVSDLIPEAVNMDVAQNQGLDTHAQRKENVSEKPIGTDKKQGKKTKKNSRSVKAVKKKEKEAEKNHIEHKVDFPEALVRAHQAAYAFLNPSIVKYDSLVELLEQATQTQVLLQPMVAFMALRYEEIIQGLEEMAEDGEKVFKEYGEHLAWPSQMKNLSSSAVKSGLPNGESPPDLLQQLLQYTTQRMRNVSHSVGGLGESALEEAVEYFSSVSELLEEKLKTKRAAETRLMHLLCRIEMASIRKPGPEDSALFSEDSGIGGESESMAGSDKQHRPESCGSTGTNRTMSASPMRYNSSNMRRKSSRQISPSISLTSLNSLGSACTIMANELRDSVLGSFSGEDEEIEENAETRDKKMLRPRSVSVDSDHPRRIPQKRIENPQNMEMTLKMKNAISGRIQFAKSKVVNSPTRTKHQWSDDKEQTPKRPQTAKAVVKKPAVTKERRSQSAESLKSKGEDPTLLELERTQKALNQKLQKISKNKTVSNSKAPPKQMKRTPILQSPKQIRKGTSLEKNVQETLNKESPKDLSSKKEEDIAREDKPVETPANGVFSDVKVNTPPTPPSSPRPSSRLSRGRNSVKKLIDTFSQGLEEREGPKVLGPLRGVKKCGVPVLPGLGNVEAVLSSGFTSCRPETDFEKTDFLDLDSLPPPPIEVLMDNSFESARYLSTEVSNDGVTKINKSPLPKRAMVSQRLKASVQPVTVLPSRGSMIQASKSASAKVDSEETAAPSKLCQPEPPQKDNNPLCQQARRIINLRSSHAEKTTSSVSSETSVSGDKSVVEDPVASVPGPNNSVFVVPPSMDKCQSPTTALVSKTRMLPSTPTTPSLLHRRLPSPSNLRRQPSPSSSSGSSTVSTPTSSATQRRLPNMPVAKQNMFNSNSASAYSFKAPSPPASPKLQQWSRQNSREDLTRKMNNARSVFCPASSSLFEAPPCPVPKPPEAWTSSRVSVLSRMWGGPGRFPAKGQGFRPLVRRTQSDRRPSLNLPSQSPAVSYAETCGSEPMIYSQGMDDDLSGEEDLWGSQSDLRATLRSVSHPDLCVVGQSLHMD